MERLARLQARIRSISDLHEVVSTVRALAAVRMRQAAEALAGAREYAGVIDCAIADALELGAPAEFRRRTSGRRAVLVFCSEHGFVGAFNETLLGRASETLDEGDLLFVIGVRGLQTAAERGLAVAWGRSMTVHSDGVGPLARDIATVLFQRFVLDDLVRLEMLFARTSGGGRWSVERHSLLPLDRGRFPKRAGHNPPLHHLPGAELILELTAEYVHAALALGAMESLAGENAARLAAMSAACENIERKLEEMHRKEHQVRQEEITTELLDVVTGSEALLQADKQVEVSASSGNHSQAISPHPKPLSRKGRGAFHFPPSPLVGEGGAGGG